jgi:hypothetical protein
MKRFFSIFLLILIIYGCKSSNRSSNWQDLKDFPIPYPKPSSKYVFPKDIVTKVKNMAEMDSMILTGLRNVGYSDFSYYRIPNGYAMVTEIESIDKEAYPLAGGNRWGIQVRQMEEFSISNYLIFLFNAQKGYYRSIVFLITNKILNSDGSPATSSEMEVIIDEGSPFLPHEAKDFPIDESYRLEALIYEFEKPEFGEATLIVPCSHQGKTHLERALILSQIQ